MGKFPTFNSHEALLGLYQIIFGNRESDCVAFFLHGGPGAGFQNSVASLFDPSFWKIVCFDQRGCGLSKPLGCLFDNNTPALVEDIEKLRQHLGILNPIVLVGGSWGTTLAVQYAQTYPQNVIGLVLRAACHMSEIEIGWVYGGGAAFLFPQAWEDFIGILPEEYRNCPLIGYYKGLMDEDMEIRERLTSALMKWNNTLSLQTKTQPMYWTQGQWYQVESWPEEIGPFPDIVIREPLITPALTYLPQIQRQMENAPFYPLAGTIFEQVMQQKKSRQIEEDEDDEDDEDNEDDDDDDGAESEIEGEEDEQESPDATRDVREPQSKQRNRSSKAKKGDQKNEQPAAIDETRDVSDPQSKRSRKGRKTKKQQEQEQKEQEEAEKAQREQEQREIEAKAQREQEEKEKAEQRKKQKSQRSDEITAEDFEFLDDLEPAQRLELIDVDEQESGRNMAKIDRASSFQNALSGGLELTVGHEELEALSLYAQNLETIPNITSRQAHALLNVHYSIHGAFQDKPLLANVHRIRHIPAIEIHGRLDFCCPLVSAHVFNKLWPEMEIRVVPYGPHSQYDVAITHELMIAIERMKDTYRILYEYAQAVQEGRIDQQRDYQASRAGIAPDEDEEEDEQLAGEREDLQGGQEAQDLNAGQDADVGEYEDEDEEVPQQT